MLINVFGAIWPFIISSITAILSQNVTQNQWSEVLEQKLKSKTKTNARNKRSKN